ncbi:MAG: hypothetical protein QOD81_237 [Solirubrobacteraceae bacterium]|nr:hypothetical protein [Solirubrobacteraceae bacterium]
MTKEIVAIALTLFVHVVGLVALIWALVLNEEERPDWRDWWPGGDDDMPLDPSPAPSRGGLPLADALPSAVRLREPARVGDGYAKPARRPAHPPERAPERVPQPR